MYPLEKIVLPEVREDDLVDAADHGRRGIHRWVLQNDQWKKIVQAYAASITFADAMVGRLLDALERSQYANNTIVVLWSDHGMHMGEKENFEKFTLWERSTHVPLLVKAPGVTQPGTRVDQPVSLMDMYPTLAELAGFVIPSHANGTSLVPLLRDAAAGHDPVVTSFRLTVNPSWHLGPALEPKTGHAVRSRDYRYIYYPEIGLEELYDRRTDPNEWANAAYKQEYAAVVEQHRQHLLKTVPDLTWTKTAPTGYAVGADGIVRNTHFVQMSAAPKGGS
jgi:arylsulfatase A-like enzyme